MGVGVKPCMLTIATPIHCLLVGDLGITLLVLLIFTLIGGFFAAAETALVSLRESQVRQLAETKGALGQRLAQLLQDPNRFLAAVQVGVTLAGFISAGYGASRIVPVLAPVIANLGVPSGLSETLAFILVTLAITYMSLVLGELVPKRIALQRGEAVALVSVRPLDLVAKLAKPFIWLVSITTNVFVRLLGMNPQESREGISGEELRGIVAAQDSLTVEERDLIDDVFRTGGRELSEVMIPRTEVEFLDGNLPLFSAARIVLNQPFSRYPVIRDRADDVLGFVHVRDLLTPNRVDRATKLHEIVRDVPRFPDSKPVLPTLQAMRRGHAHLAIVVDEYGGTAGIVTMEDLVEEIIGEIEDEYDLFISAPRIGETEISGLLHLDDFAERTGINLPDGVYETVAGYIVAQLGRLAQVGDRVGAPGAELQVAELDGRRISSVRVTQLATAATSGFASHSNGESGDSRTDHDLPDGHHGLASAAKSRSATSTAAVIPTTESKEQ